MNPKPHLLLPFRFLVLILLLEACNPPRPIPVINVKTPAENEYIPNDYTITIENIDRYDELIAGTFQAWLDPGTGKEKEITSGFAYDASTKTWSSLLSLDTGAHELVTQAKYAYPDDPVRGVRTFIVYQPTCVTGKIQTFASNDQTKLYPFEGALLEVHITATDQLITTGVANSDGTYCIDGVPAVNPLTIIIPPNQNCPPWNFYSTQKTIDNILLTDPYRSCPEACNSINDILVQCHDI